MNSGVPRKPRTQRSGVRGGC